MGTCENQIYPPVPWAGEILLLPRKSTRAEESTRNVSFTYVSLGPIGKSKVEHPTRVAYLKFQSLKTGETYCQYGIVRNSDDEPVDCAEVPYPQNSTGTAEEKKKYRPSILSSCVCTAGTSCNHIIANAGVAAVGSTIFVRIALGTLLERSGPVNVQSGLLSFGALWVALAASISAPWNYTLIRFFTGCVGAGN